MVIFNSYVSHNQRAYFSQNHPIQICKIHQSVALARPWILERPWLEISAWKKVLIPRSLTYRIYSKKRAWCVLGILYVLYSNVSSYIIHILYMHICLFIYWYIYIYVCVCVCIVCNKYVYIYIVLYIVFIIYIYTFRKSQGHIFRLS
jgi:hypothetical protein